MKEELLLGNALIGKGLFEHWCHIVTSYLGTPSYKILQAVIKF
jgi:hypothetical protein